MLYCDAHFHACCCPELAGAGGSAPAAAENGPFRDSFRDENTLSDGADRFFAASCAHDREEFERQEQLVQASGGHILPLFGMHPQLPLLENADYMEGLLRDRRIIGIGETGFDLFTPEFRAKLQAQEEAWQTSLALAARYQVPVVVHDRKALDFIFRDAGRLRGLPAVIFHSFAFGPREARSILQHGIHAYFSFAKQILNGNKKSRACVKDLPLDCLLLETDAPYQTLRGEERTSPFEIRRVYAEAALIRDMPQDELAAPLQENFTAAFGIRHSRLFPPAPSRKL